MTPLREETNEIIGRKIAFPCFRLYSRPEWFQAEWISSLKPLIYVSKSYHRPIAFLEVSLTSLHDQEKGRQIRAWCSLQIKREKGWDIIDLWPNAFFLIWCLYLCLLCVSYFICLINPFPFEFYPWPVCWRRNKEITALLLFLERKKRRRIYFWDTIWDLVSRFCGRTLKELHQRI